MSTLLPTLDVGRRTEGRAAASAARACRCASSSTGGMDGSGAATSIVGASDGGGGAGRGPSSLRPQDEQNRASAGSSVAQSGQVAGGF